MATARSASETPNSSFTMQRLPETLRLQKNTEEMIAKLEFERRKSQQLNENILAIKKQIKDKSQQKHQFFQWKKQESAHKNQLKLLENRLQDHKVKLSQIRSHNKSLRDEIEFLRKEKHSKQLFTGRISTQISSIKEEVQAISKQANEQQTQDTDNRIRILTLGNTLEEERQMFGQHVSTLESHILEDSKQRSKLLKAGKEEGIKQSYLTEVSKLLHHLLEKWSTLIREKKQALEAYKRNVNKITNNLQVMQYHSGIDEVQDLVQIITSTYDQNKEIESYIVRVHEQTSHIEEELNQCRMQMKAMSSGSSQNVNVQQKTVQNRKDVLNKLENQGIQKANQLELIRLHCQNVGQVFLEIHQKLCNLGFQIDMPVLDQADERNIKDMSVVIEEQLARFILFWNEWNARPNALTSLINVQAMPDKVNRVDQSDYKDIINQDLVQDDNEHEVLTVSQMRERMEEFLKNNQ